MAGKCNIAIGQGGVYRVVSELIFRGHAPYIPVADDHGVDVLLPTGIRIQVKTARLHTRKGRHKYGVTEMSGYWLSLGWTQSGRVHTPIRRKLKYSDECDYFVIFGVDEQRFWIVPSFIMDNKTCLFLGPKPKPSSEAVQAHLASGKGVLQTAAELGISRGTVWYRKRGDIKRGGWTRAVRMCEGRWDLLNVPSADWMKESEGEQEVQQLEQLLKK
jgi:hypothetical protein